ncbi:hypothetical protein VNO77_19155 [Canavalia gladiata]|uniref:Uncharacterized protein n=1 Tax=Canavalia gladiata TaxID=3824 RepID=A0AAN9LR16_CANGL
MPSRMAFMASVVANILGWRLPRRSPTSGLGWDNLPCQELRHGALAISRASCFSWCDLRVGCGGSRQRSGWPERGSAPPLQQVSGSCSELEFPRFWPSGLARVWVKPPPCSVTPIPARRTFEFTGSLVRLGEKRWRDNGSSGVRDAIPKADGGEISIG